MDINSFLQVAIIINILASTLRISTPLLLASMGELVTERSGIWNMGCEGTMLMGAFVGFLITNKSGSLILGTVAAIIAGGLLGLIMVVMATSLKLDQTVIGMTLNLFASGLSVFWYKIAFHVQGEEGLPAILTAATVKIPILSNIPFIGEIFFSQKLLTYFAFLLVPAVWFLLYRTWLGLEIRSLGEYPRAVDMRGLHVNRLQYFSVIFGGMLVGLAGSFLSLGASDRFIPGMSAGRGWLAIVIIIAGNWQPFRILLVTLIFAFLDALQLQLQGVGVQFPYQVLLALPYILAILVMMSSRAKSIAPGWLSIPYNRED